MKNLRGLFFNLIGVIKDASLLPQETKRILRGNRSIEVMQDRRDREKWTARITFLRKEDGSFISPATALAEEDMDYFLIQVVNTYKGSTIVVETGAKDKPKDIWVDEREIERCDIGGGAGTVMRVSQNGNVEVHRVTSPTVNNKKQIKVFTLFEENLPFENEHLLNVVIADDENLKEFGEDLKKAYAAITERKFENKMDLSEAKYRTIQNKDQEIKRVEAPAEKEAPVEKPETAPESEEVKPEPETKKAAPKKKAAKTTRKKKGDPDKNKTSKHMKRAKAEDEEKEAEKEIREAKKGGGKTDSFEKIAEIAPLNK